jgi:hypothetical protein
MTTKTRKAESITGKAPQEAPIFEESMTAIISWPIEAWLRCQAGMLEAAAPVANDWIERRRQGADAALTAFARLVACGDLQEAASVHREWLEGSMKRLDLHAIADHAVAMSHEAVTATRYAAQSSSEAAERAAAAQLRTDEAAERAA